MDSRKSIGINSNLTHHNRGGKVLLTSGMVGCELLNTVKSRVGKHDESDETRNIEWTHCKSNLAPAC